MHPAHACRALPKHTLQFAYVFWPAPVLCAQLTISQITPYSVTFDTAYMPIADLFNATLATQDVLPPQVCSTSGRTLTWRLHSMCGISS